MLSEREEALGNLEEIEHAGYGIKHKIVALWGGERDRDKLLAGVLSTLCSRMLTDVCWRMLAYADVC
jgi:hypothetical protein